MFIDIHLHTYRYSPCSWMSPEELIFRAEEVGLDGIVITEHNKVWRKDEIKDFNIFGIIGV